MEVSELQANNQSNARQLNTDSLVSADIANVLGMEYNEEDNKSLILGDELAGYDIVILSNKSKDELEETYSGLSNLGEAKLSDYTVVDLTSSIDTDIDTDDAQELITKEDLKSYSEPNASSTVVNEYQRNTKNL